jgi:uncharacterized protein YjbI with pentapeptide repeats
MLIENQEFTTITPPPNAGGRIVFRDCNWSDVHDSAFPATDSIFENFEFTDTRFYYEAIIGAIFIDCNFCHCKFSGVAFLDSTFLRCAFTDGEFDEDSFGGKCSMTDTKMYDCVVKNCVGWVDAWMLIR